MLHVELDQQAGIATLRPEGSLTADDFRHAASVIDPFVEQHGALRGLVIRSRGFPGWDSLGAMRGHFRFVRDHHRELSRVALVTDTALGNLAQTLAGHFVAAEVRRFAFDDLDAARAWILADH